MRTQLFFVHFFDCTTKKVQKCEHSTHLWVQLVRHHSLVFLVPTQVPEYAEGVDPFPQWLGTREAGRGSQRLVGGLPARGSAPRGSDTAAVGAVC